LGLGGFPGMVRRTMKFKMCNEAAKVAMD